MTTDFSGDCEAIIKIILDSEIFYSKLLQYRVISDKLIEHIKKYDEVSNTMMNEFISTVKGIESYKK